MTNSFTILVGSIIVLALLSYMFLYQVRYDQVAVRTTFDRAEDGSVQSTPGLKWRLPWPIHKVTHYSKRLQLLEVDSRLTRNPQPRPTLLRSTLHEREGTPEEDRRRATPTRPLGRVLS